MYSKNYKSSDGDVYDRYNFLGKELENEVKRWDKIVYEYVWQNIKQLFVYTIFLRDNKAKVTSSLHFTARSFVHAKMNVEVYF